MATGSADPPLRRHLLRVRRITFWTERSRADILCLRHRSAYDRRDFFKGTGISVYANRRRASEMRRRFSLGSALATLTLAAEGIVWSATGRRGHITVWAAPETLLAQVVQCESDVD